jgi:uncharacterized low-complexity protein
MKTLKVVLAVAAIAAAGVVAPSVGSLGSVEAKAHVTKGKPGKCGPGKFYSKKERGCVAKS